LNPLAYCDPNGLREEPRAGSGVIQSEQELYRVEIQEEFQGFVWDSRNPAPFHTQFFAWLNYHPEERQKAWGAPDWSLKMGVSVNIVSMGLQLYLDIGHLTLATGATFSIGTFFGASIDVELSRMISQDRIRVEAGAGLTKHCSIGVLLDTRARERAYLDGLTLHIGPGLGAPVQLSVPLRASLPR